MATTVTTAGALARAHATENGAFLVENHTKVTWKVDRRAVFDTKVQQLDRNGRSNDDGTSRFDFVVLFVDRLLIWEQTW